jgi:alpha-mannosidase
MRAKFTLPLLLLVACCIFAHADDTDRVIADLNTIASNDAGTWLFHGPGIPDASAPAFDDSAWPQVRPEHQWEGENAFSWYRKHIKIPQRVAGVDVTGSKLTLLIGCDDAGEVYVNGALKQKFAWDKGNCVLTDNSQPGDELVVAVKCINYGGPGRLLSASLHWSAFEPAAAGAARAAEALSFAKRLADLQKDPAQYRPVIAQAAAKVDFAAIGRRDYDVFGTSVDTALAALKPLAQLSKQYEVYLVGHAHIDMNWLWLWPETKDVCNRTWTQACNFMEEFPQFKFSQSQPGAYIAIQKEHPELFARMQAYARQGRWDITGGTWVEGDMDMPSGESIVRNIMLARQYYLDNFGKAPEIGWCPDTFGHAWTVPTIMANSGLKYYYFCRCGKGIPLFWWEGPDGSRLLAYNRGGYGDRIDAGIAEAPLDLERQAGVRKGMVVYGVGDHGGGPTREDINEALALQKRDVFPQVKFSTTSEFYSEALAARQPGKDFPIVKDELNTTFEGCYTTHANVKRWNRELENTLPVAETLSLLATKHGFQYPQDGFTQAWRNTCFNQFHDIFCGSAIHASYEYSGQLYQEGISVANSARDGALGALAKDIAVPNVPGTIPVIVYNPLSWERDDVVEVTIPAPTHLRSIAVATADGKARFAGQVISEANGQAQVMFVAQKVPPVGYATYLLLPNERVPGVRITVRRAPQSEPSRLYNDRYVVDVDPKTGGIARLYDAQLQRDLLAPGAEGNVLQALQEDPHGMSAWNLGPIKSTENLASPLSVSASRRGDVMQSVRIEHKFRSSAFTQEIRMYAGLPRIDVILKADWREVGNAQTGGPMMKVAFPVAAQRPQATFEIPYGSIERACNGAEVPAQKWVDLTETAVSRLDGKQAAAAETVDIAKWFNQDGISGLEHPLDGVFDFGGWALPAEMFAGAGTASASAKNGIITIEGVPFIAPPLEDGKKNMISCEGQRLDLPPGRSQSLQVMGAASNGTQSGPLQLIYADGSEETVNFGFSDWCAAPGAGERLGLHAEYRVSRTGKDTPPCSVFIRDLPLRTDKTLKALVLPNQPHIHILAITRSAAVVRKPLYGLSLLNNCKYGYDVKGGVMRLSLLRCSYDPDPTPDQGEHEITYSIVPHAGDWRTGQTVRRAFELNEPLVAVVVAPHTGQLPAQRSFASLEPGNLVLTALKRAEDGRGMIARFYEAEGKDCTAVLRVQGARRAIETNLVEADKPNAVVKVGNDGTVRLTVKAHQPKCVRLLTD